MAIDLIPDFIPVWGYLDDPVLLPLGIALTVKLIPPTVLEDCRRRARETLQSGKPVSRAAGAVIIGIWVFLTAVCVGWLYQTFRGLDEGIRET